MDKKYLIDANILIKFQHFTPREYHQRFWQALADQVKQGKIVILDKVAEECRGRWLNIWLQESDISQLVVTVDSATRQKAVEINDQYQMITQEPGGSLKSVADTYMIAYAQQNNLSIFSDEQGKRPPQTVNKIPDVCDDLQIGYKRNPIAVMHELQFDDCSNPRE